jgi:hypothetical protein
MNGVLRSRSPFGPVLWVGRALGVVEELAEGPAGVGLLDAPPDGVADALLEEDGDDVGAGVPDDGGAPELTA